MSPIIVFLLSLSSLAFAISEPPSELKDEAPAVAITEPETTQDEPLPTAEAPVEEEPAAVTEPEATDRQAITPLPAFPTAAGNCQHIEPPACAIQAGGFTDNDVARACRDELQGYIENIRQYSTCRREALREITNLTRDSMTQAQETARRTTQLFNCRLRDETDCN